MEHLFSNLTEDMKLRMWCIEMAAQSNQPFNKDKLTLANEVYNFIVRKNKSVPTKVQQIPEFAECYILRDFDLRPEKLSEYPIYMNSELALELIKQKLLFQSKEEALIARDLMLSSISSR